MNLHIGLIGAGTIGTVHLSCIKKIIEDGVLSKFEGKIKIKGIADTDKKKLENLKRNNPFNVEVFTTDPDELIRDKDINVIYITTPTKYHGAYYFKAAKEGKHIFCEKPIAFSSSEIDEMIKMEKKNALFVQVGLVLRHSPVFWKLKQVMRENEQEQGKPLSFIFRDAQEWPVGSRLHPSLWRKDPYIAHAGCLFEHSIHDIDMLEYLFSEGRNIKDLHANIRYVSSLTLNNLEDVADSHLSYNDGLTGDLISIWNNAKMDERRIEIYHENAFTLLDGYTATGFNEFYNLMKRKKKKFDFNDVTSEYIEQKGYKIKSLGIGPFFYENINFLESLLLERKPYPSLSLGFRAHQIIEAAYRSSMNNEIIEIL